MSPTHPLPLFAFKEWALICQALGSGYQSLLLRKGGIAEGREGFSFKRSEFFLFPTWFHGQVEKIAPQYALSLLSKDFYPDIAQRKSEPHQPPDTLHLEYVVSIEWSDFITDREKLAPLSALHVLSESAIEERFYYQNKRQESRPGVHVAFLRVYRLDHPVKLKMEKRFKGCLSWVELPEMTMGTCVPVLSHEEHDKRRKIFDSIMKI